jgi:hypothetical protein
VQIHTLCAIGTLVDEAYIRSRARVMLYRSDTVLFTLVFFKSGINKAFMGQGKSTARPLSDNENVGIKEAMIDMSIRFARVLCKTDKNNNFVNYTISTLDMGCEIWTYPYYAMEPDLYVKLIIDPLRARPIHRPRKSTITPLIQVDNSDKCLSWLVRGATDEVFHIQTTRMPNEIQDITGKTTPIAAYEVQPTKGTTCKLPELYALLAFLYKCNMRKHVVRAMTDTISQNMNNMIHTLSVSPYVGASSSYDAKSNRRRDIMSSPQRSI